MAGALDRQVGNVFCDAAPAVASATLRSAAPLSPRFLRARASANRSRQPRGSTSPMQQVLRFGRPDAAVRALPITPRGTQKWQLQRPSAVNSPSTVFSGGRVWPVTWACPGGGLARGGLPRSDAAWLGESLAGCSGPLARQKRGSARPGRPRRRLGPLLAKDLDGRRFPNGALLTGSPTPDRQ